MTIVTDDGDVIRRRLLTVDNNELLAVDLDDTGQGRHIFQAPADSDPETVTQRSEDMSQTLSHTVGNSAVQVNNAGVDAAMNIAYLNGLEKSLWQLLQVETERRPDVPLQTFAINTRRVLLSMGTSLGPFVQSVRPVGFESLLLTATIIITLILEMNSTFGNLSTNTLQCVVSNLTGETNLLSGEQLDVVVKSCMGVGNQLPEQTTGLVRLSTCGGSLVPLEPTKCNTLPDVIANLNHGEITTAGYSTLLIVCISICLVYGCVCSSRYLSVVVAYLCFRVLWGFGTNHTLQTTPMPPPNTWVPSLVAQECGVKEIDTTSLMHLIKKAKLNPETSSSNFRAPPPTSSGLHTPTSSSVRY
ncbi:hypothetical protein T484DRAFT_1755976 [Baffinella frigidus]|nr:hypothetical protein T484DRAFT_1755976 [Cryptophyta sp. CCMP2293]